MAEGKRAEHWCWWSEILALTANCHRNPKKSQALSAEAINPYRRKSRRNKANVGEFVQAMKARYGRIGGQGGSERTKKQASKSNHDKGSDNGER